jgi:uncharacterized protein
MKKSTYESAPMAARMSAVAFALFAAVAIAGPDDDYRAGLAAYKGGDMTGAMSRLKKPADQGYAPAQALLADILDKADFNDEAVAYYRKAADQGHPDGEYGLGTMYAAGEGVKRDLATARTWITRAAEKGHAQAINTLAQAYMTGGLALDESSRAGSAGLQWVRRSADYGFLPSLEYLANAYRTGALGLAIDVKQAEALEARVRSLRGVRAADKGKKGKS